MPVRRISMSKTCKKLLASALAATMLFSTFVSSLVVSAAATGTLKIGTETITVGTESATVDFTLTFSEAVAAPHDLATIVAKNANEETLTITAAELGEVVYVVDGVEQNTPYIDGIAPDDEVEPPSVSVESTNLTAGKILFGSGVASAADVKVINFTVTFDTTTATVGTYTVTATTDGTDYDEADVVVTTEDGAIVVEEPHTCTAGEATDNGDGTHDIACAGNCGKLFADNEACNYVEGICDVCGAEEPVDECEHVNATLEYSVVDGNCITTKVCPDCDDYSEVIASLANRTLKHALIYENDLTLNFRVDVTTQDRSTYSDFIGCFTKEMFEGTLTDEGYVPDYKEVNYTDYSSTRLQFAYSGIRAKELASEIKAQIFGVDAEGNRILIAYENYSLVKYLRQVYDVLASKTDASNVAQRQLVVQIAQYGAAAQEKFNYNKDDKASSYLPTDEVYDLIPSEDFVTVEENKTGITFGRAVDYKDKILVNIRYAADSATTGSKLVIDYKNTLGEDLQKIINFEDFAVHTDGRWQVVFDAMTAATISSKFTYTLYDAQGNVVGASSYSLENYAKTITDRTGVDPAEKELVNRLICYGRAANEYFANK